MKDSWKRHEEVCENTRVFFQVIEGDLQRKEQQHADTMRRQQQYINSLKSQLRSCRDDEKMKYRKHMAEVQQQMDQSVQGC